MNKEETAKKLIEAKDAYYNDKPIITDLEFDELEDELRKIDPDNDYFKIVGAKIKSGKKIKHKYTMRSMNKAKTIEEIEKWLNKIVDRRIELIIEPKVDGLSASIVYENGNLSYIATRGGGNEGQDITHIIDYMKTIPKKIPEDNRRVEILGELFLPKDTNFPNPENKPLRNICSGLINRKENLEDLKYVKFVAYNVIIDNLEFRSELQKLYFILGSMFPIVESFKVHSIKEINQFYENYLNELRQEWRYDTDGLVIVVNDNFLHKEINLKYVVDHHNHFNIALKPPAQSKITKLLGINWQISRNGNLIPVAVVKPIVISGSIIQNVTLNNYENVIKLNITKANEVEVSKAGEIIPFFNKIISYHNEEQFDLPDRCYSCGFSLEKIKDDVHIKCLNKDCPEQKIQQIIYWVQKSEMDGVSEATIRTLYEERLIKNSIDLYRFTNDEKIYMTDEIEGFGEKKVQNLIEQIEKSRNVSVQDFLARLGISLVGKKALKKLNINSLNDFWNFNDRTYVIGQNLIDYREENKIFIEELVKLLNISKKNNILYNKGLVCMTGKGPKGRKELIQEIENMGYEFTNNINKDTNILICEDVNDSSKKLDKAKKLSIKLLSYKEFFGRN